MYTVERYVGGKWSPRAGYEEEDRKLFESIAAVEEYRYRILLDGKDITKQYIKHKKGDTR